MHKAVNKTLLLMAVASVTTQSALASDQSDSKGFLDGSSLTLTNRNFYMNRDYHDGYGNIRSADGSYRVGETADAAPGEKTNGYRKEWAQAFILDYSSGFTQGPVGVGVDAYGFLGLKLDAGGGSGGNLLLPYGKNGPGDNISDAGGSIKLRYSNTVLKYGEMYTDNPVFDTTTDWRLLPETATGFQLTSSEVEGLKVQAGHFTALTSVNSSNSKDGIYFSYAAAAPADSVDFAGASYAWNSQFSTTLYASNVEDAWHQVYTNLNFVQPINSTQSLMFDFNLYRTVDSGSSNLGQINNTTYSAAGSYTVGAHTFILSTQKVHGDTPFDYVGNDSIYLNNSSQYSDFNAPNERSWALAYNLDMQNYGVPGLSFRTRYVRGSDIDGTHADPRGAYAGYYGDDGKHWERDIEARYIVQSGPVKGLSTRLRQATHRANADQGEHNLDEVRLIVSYPLNIL